MPDEMGNILEKYLAWTARLKDEGIYLAGEELKDSGRDSFRLQESPHRKKLFCRSEQKLSGVFFGLGSPVESR